MDSLTRDGTVLYVTWMLLAVLFAVYQYLYVFAYPIWRPTFYEEISLIGLLGDARLSGQKADKFHEDGCRNLPKAT